LSVPSLEVLAELQEQLLARERQLDSHEGFVVVWEESGGLRSHAQEGACGS
jgi:hypothetical protein